MSMHYNYATMTKIMLTPILVMVMLTWCLKITTINVIITRTVTMIAAVMLVMIALTFEREMANAFFFL